MTMPNDLAGPLAKVRSDIEEAMKVERSLWNRTDEDVLGHLIDCRIGLEALIRAVSTLTLAVERLAERQQP